MQNILEIFFSPSKRKYKKRKKPILKREPLGLSKKKYLERKVEFLKNAEEKVKFYNKFYNFEYGKISIRNQKTRWGSCSSKGNLNFNYRVFLLEEGLLDYIIVHELCHLKHMNHSQDFWNEVEKQIINYKDLKEKIKKYYFI